VHIEFTFARDRAYFRPQLLPAARLRTTAPRRWAWLAILGGVALVAAYHEKAAGPVLGAGLVASGVAALVVRHRTIVTMVTVPESWCAPRRWLLTADGLESSTELSSVTHPWSAFRRGSIVDDAYLLFLDGAVIVDIPRSPLAAEQDTELRALLRERGILAAGR
jgi:hypothetical protein